MRPITDSEFEELTDRLDKLKYDFYDALLIVYDSEVRRCQLTEDQWATIGGATEELRGWCDDIEYWTAPLSEGVTRVASTVAVQRAGDADAHSGITLRPDDLGGISGGGVQ